MTNPTEFLLYDGTHVWWKNPGDGQGEMSYRASSGLDESSAGGTDYRNEQYQCVKDRGPVPGGLYVLKLKIDQDGTEHRAATCTLMPSWEIQTIPRGSAAPGDCDQYWANWGYNRVRIEAANVQTRSACSPRRGGFYLHDSTKGYSHGCIEVDTQFFTRLRAYVRRLGTGGSRKRLLNLRVDYRQKDMATYGYTDQPDFVGPIP